MNAYGYGKIDVWITMRNCGYAKDLRNGMECCGKGSNMTGMEKFEIVQCASMCACACAWDREFSELTKS